MPASCRSARKARARRRALASLALALIAAGCSASERPVRADPPSAAVDSRAEILAALDSPLRPPALRGKGSIAPRPPAGSAPSHEPAQAGPMLRSHPLPTNQWWTSALVGPWTQPLIAGPVGVKVDASGVALSYSPPNVGRDHVVRPFAPAVQAANRLDGVAVAAYGAFHVVLASPVAGGGSLRTTIVEGDPVVSFSFSGVREPRFHVPGTATADGAVARASVGGRLWAVAATAGIWRRDGADL